jgi:hypothetical protein
VDKEIKLDLERLDRELELFDRVSRERQELAEKEGRHLGSVKSLIQLIINRATEIDTKLPPFVVQHATRLSISVPSRLHPTTETGPDAQTQKPDGPLESEFPTENKTDFVRKVIASRAAVGVTPAEIKKLANALKMDAASNFPHTILFKLKAQKEIEEKDGKYFPSAKEEGW